MPVTGDRRRPRHEYGIKMISYDLSKLMSRVKLNGAAQKLQQSSELPFVYRVCAGTGFDTVRVWKKCHSSVKGTLFFFTTVHILSARRGTHEYPIIPKTERTQEEVVRTTHPLLSLFPSRMYAPCTHGPAMKAWVCIMHGRARAVESLSLHLANPHPVYSARNNALDVALPSGRGKRREPL